MEKLFTPAAVLDLLTQIDELRAYGINITETIDGQLQLTIGDSIYMITDEVATHIDVEDAVVNQIEDINMAAYEELAETGDIDLQEPVESGILSTLAKALAIGGVVLLGKKLLS